METLILLALAAVPFVTAAAVFGRRNADASWEQAAGLLNLVAESSGGRGDLRLTGRVGTADILVDRFERQRENKQIPWTRIRSGTDIPRSLLVGGDGFWRHWKEKAGQDVVELAGVAFDDHVVVRGEIPEIFGLLNGDARAQFRELEKRYRAFVQDGLVQVELEGITHDPQELARLVRQVASLAMTLSLQGPSLDDRLAANVVTDPNAIVRLRNLEVLLERFPDSPQTPLACQHALGDRSYAVCVLAAQHCGDEGLPTLERALADARAPLDLRAQSLSHLVALLSPDEAISFLIDVVESYPALRTAAVVGLAEQGVDPGLDVLLGLLVPAKATGWIAYARAISALGRHDLLGPIEALLDEEALVETLEFDLEPAEGAETPADAPTIVVEITSDLRIDLAVQQAAREALHALTNTPLASLTEADDTQQHHEGLPQDVSVEEIPSDMDADTATTRPEASAVRPSEAQPPPSEVQLEPDAE